MGVCVGWSGTRAGEGRHGLERRLRNRARVDTRDTLVVCEAAAARRERERPPLAPSGDTGWLGLRESGASRAGPGDVCAPCVYGSSPRIQTRGKGGFEVWLMYGSAVYLVHVSPFLPHTYCPALGSARTGLSERQRTHSGLDRIQWIEQASDTAHQLKGRARWRSRPLGRVWPSAPNTPPCMHRGCSRGRAR